jgi:hypothetical protein
MAGTRQRYAVPPHLFLMIPVPPHWFLARTRARCDLGHHGGSELEPRPVLPPPSTQRSPRGLVAGAGIPKLSWLAPAHARARDDHASPERVPRRCAPDSTLSTPADESPARDAGASGNGPEPPRGSYSVGDLWRYVALAGLCSWAVDRSGRVSAGSTDPTRTGSAKPRGLTRCNPYPRVEACMKRRF